MRLVVALGGNALLPRGERPDAAPQVEQVKRAAAPLAQLAAEHDLVLIHGNGPQVGLLALESSADTSLSAPYPLSDLVAETQGLIGYWLQQAVANVSGAQVVTLVSQTVVDAADPAFASPTKFVGASCTKEEADTQGAAHGWVFRSDGPAWRRVVPSPLPQRIVETEVAGLLLRHGIVVVLAGGGGVPVVETDVGFRGVEAVVDKDLAAALVAEHLGADLLVLLTDVPAVMVDFGGPDQRSLRHVTASELSSHAFPSGSMGPKVDAACSFVTRTGSRAAIGALSDAVDVVLGRAGTQVH